MTRPLVSVVIPTYNHGGYVTGAVDSVLQQSYRPLELVVVDDGSTDGTEKLLQPYGSRIRYLYQENRGVAAARNLGIARSSGELVAFLDADDRWLPDKLEAQVAALAARPEAGLGYTNAYLWDPPREVDERSLRLGRPEFDGRCYARLFWSGGICLSSVMVWRTCLARVGVFDETLRGASVEDYDLLWRVARQFEFVYLAPPLVLYRTRPAHETRTAARLQDELYVIGKRLREDPELRTLIGSRGIRRRLFRLWSDLGHLRLEAGALPEARRAFREAARQEPARLPVWGLWLGLRLPPRTFMRLRRAKQGLTRGQRPPSSGSAGAGAS